MKEECIVFYSFKLKLIFFTSRLKSNQSKNRYSDVLCYDHSRVKISCIDADPSSDYLNANFVDGFRQKNAFISTQGIFHYNLH